MLKAAARAMSVEAARAKPRIPAEEAAISAPSSSNPGRKRRRKKYTATTSSVASSAEGNRAAQSLTPKMEYAIMACQ
jgi:hypothetical protein